VEAPVTGPSWIAVGTLVGAGVLLANFAVFAAASSVESGSLAGSCGASVGRFCTDAQVSALAAENLVADISWIGAAAVGAAGLIFLFVLPPERGPLPAAAVAPMFGPGPGGLVVGGRF
jgi:hypothetical protein